MTKIIPKHGNKNNKAESDSLVEKSNFNFILRHNCLVSEMRLCKIGLASNARCKVCTREDDEGVRLLFFKCELKCL